MKRGSEKIKVDYVKKGSDDRLQSTVHVVPDPHYMLVNATELTSVNAVTTTHTDMGIMESATHRTAMV